MKIKLVLASVGRNLAQTFSLGFFHFLYKKTFKRLAEKHFCGLKRILKEKRKIMTLQKPENTINLNFFMVDSR